MRPANLDGCGVIFDLDGVLVDSYAAHFKSWKALAEEIGRPITEPEFAATFGRRSAEIIQALFDGGCTDDEVGRLDARKEAIYRELIRARVPLMPGAVDAVARLRQAGAKVGIGSSGPPANVCLVLDALRAAGPFDAVVTGVDVTRGKPDPQVFLLAAERMSIPPSNCSVIEDAPAGIEAAQRAGMFPIGFRGARTATSPPGARVVIERLADVEATVAQHWQRGMRPA